MITLVRRHISQAGVELTGGVLHMLQWKKSTLEATAPPHLRSLVCGSKTSLEADGELLSLGKVKSCLVVGQSSQYNH